MTLAIVAAGTWGVVLLFAGRAIGRHLNATDAAEESRRLSTVPPPTASAHEPALSPLGASVGDGAADGAPEPADEPTQPAPHADR